MTSTLETPPLSLDSAAPALPYLGGVDGLRAISVLAVIGFHAELGGLKGGFLGVEVFFVISGYLITSLLVTERRRDGRISLREFWLRRARRLLPALYLLLAGVIVLAAVFASDAMSELRRDTAAALLYVSNWVQIFGHQSYAEAAGRPSLLKHLWSLAVEEQFYLMWPLVVVLLMGRIRRAWFAMGCVAVAALSAVIMALAYNPDLDPSALYYNTFLRLSGLLLGSAFAMFWRPGRLRVPAHPRAAGWVMDAVAVVGLVALGVMFARLSYFDPLAFQGGFVLVDIATIMVLAAVVHPSARIGRLLGAAPLVWIGLRSYGLYLWHWPVFQLTRPGIDVDLHGFQLFALRFVLVVGATELSYRLVEIPLRKGAVGRWWRRRHSISDRERLEARTVGVVGAAIPIGLAAVLIWGPSAAASDSLAAGQAKALATAPLLSVVRRSTTTTAPTTTVGPDGSTEVATTAAPTTAPPPPPSAIAGLVDTADPPPTSAPDPSLPNTPVAVSAIGDSVMLGAQNALKRNIPGILINAKVARQFGEVRDVVAGMLQFNTLGHVVLIHLGTNGVVTDGLIDDVMRLVGPARSVYFVTPKVPRSWEEADNIRLKNAPTRWPNAHIIDWYTASVNNPALFVKDATHLTPAGVIAYTQLVLNSFN